ncbi:Lrp/AsnC family transcriptional regulator [Rhodanobacter sp. OK091]|jgi:Lrp/AsnC family transcriptional regulator, leucine-responsive regulatory protein|uniref:Lrp/AsnC family transcriptional regulator n=1 Tax=Rhodanobacter sp. OK091 TaxID=1881037 RepID=UPI0009205A54|nr:Lrp/AsnC family transcriptional regulator [Rhodanobacter sp. OK091]SHL85773.1 transcriptional regulator, AsnC family [Rhodanobacter sp. OK091]
MIDNIDSAILRLLAGNARLSLKELAASIPLSAPSTSERLRRLEERGVIRAYTVDLEPKLLGHALQAIVRVRPLPGRLRVVQELIESMPEIVECDKVTGDDCFVARLFARSMEHLDELVDRLAVDATTSTAIVKGQLIARRPPPMAPV